LSALLNSFKTTTEIQQDPFGLPVIVRFSNYVDAWVLGGFLDDNGQHVDPDHSARFWLVAVIAGLAAFALARFALPAPMRSVSI
jgi:hypothetical protein